MDPHQTHYFSSRLHSDFSPTAFSEIIKANTVDIWEAVKSSKADEEVRSPHDQYMLPEELSGPRSEFGSSMNNTWPWKLELKNCSAAPSEFGLSMDNTLWPWKLELKNNEFVTVKATQPLGNFGGEEVKKIPKEEAICRFCFDVYQANMLKTSCRCKVSLLHESCANEWLHDQKGNSKCNVCDQDIQNVPVTVSSDHVSSTSTTTNKELITSSTSRTRNKELQRGSTRKRSWSSYCCFGL